MREPNKQRTLRLLSQSLTLRGDERTHIGGFSPERGTRPPELPVEGRRGQPRVTLASAYWNVTALVVLLMQVA
jgi:hypothetical protein